MTTTSQIRSWWAPACQAKTISLTPAYRELDAQFRKHSYRPRSGVTGAFNCRRITGGTGYSLHAYDPDGFFTFWSGVRITKALAVDVNWDTNPYGPTLKTDMPMAMILDIEKIKTRNGKQVWRWGGRYTNNKDAMHFEIIVSPADLATGVYSQPSVPTPAPTPPTTTPVKDDDMAVAVKGNTSARVYATDWIHKNHIPNQAQLAQMYLTGLRSNNGQPFVVDQATIDGIPEAS